MHVAVALYYLPRACCDASHFISVAATGILSLMQCDVYCDDPIH